MNARDDHSSPLVGEGREGGRSDWAPADRSRQKDFTRTNARAKRLRADVTKSEALLWKHLRQFNRDGATFRRQAAMGGFVFDFANFSARLLIELDGGVHNTPDVMLLDERKSAWADAQGFRLLRISNDDVWTRPDAMIDRIRSVLNAPHPNPSPHGGGA
jgi:very-short-patch-repair endonuclease